MGKTKIIIEMPTMLYLTLKLDGVWGYPRLTEIIRNGKPLPKEHGDLISKEQAIELVEFYQLNPQHFDFVNLIDEIKDEKPIIEADGGGDDEKKDSD